MKFFRNLNGNTFKVTTAVSVVLFVSSLLNNYVLDQPGPRLDIDINGNGNKTNIKRSIAFECYDGWDTTKSTVNQHDPATNESLVVCTSADGRYIATSRDGVAPKTVLDTVTASWKDVAEVVK